MTTIAYRRVLAFGLVLVVSGVQGVSWLNPIIPPIEILESIPVIVSTGYCDETHLKFCQQKFNRLLNITEMLDWTSVDVLVNATDSILERGVDDGLLLLCSVRSTFYQCLGAMYDPCISRFHFLHQGFSQRQAAAYVEVFRELEFMCTGGILQAINKWTCIVKNKRESDSVYNSCLDDYHNHIEENPSDICRAAYGMALCARMPYVINCGYDVGWWECERVRIALDIDSYCPNQNCYYSLMPQNAKKLPSRYELFHMPNPYFMSREKQEFFAWLGARATERARRKKK